MRIRDWSSDVCSSDLHIATAAFDAIEESLLLRTRPLFTTDLAQQQLRQQLRRTRLCAVAAADAWHFGAGIAQLIGSQYQHAIAGLADRKIVVGQDRKSTRLNSSH